MNNDGWPFYGMQKIMDDFGCEYCAGTGYEDYPTNKKPCRMSGHRQRGDADVRRAGFVLALQRRHYDHERDGRCPYCHATTECVHWSGLGWTRDKTERGWHDAWGNRQGGTDATD